MSAAFCASCSSPAAPRRPCLRCAKAWSRSTKFGTPSFVPSELAIARHEAWVLTNLQREYLLEPVLLGLVLMPDDCVGEKWIGRNQLARELRIEFLHIFDGHPGGHANLSLSQPYAVSMHPVAASAPRLAG